MTAEPLTPAPVPEGVPSEAAANDTLDICAEDLHFQAQEEPTFRLVFRDQAGKVHTATHRSTFRPHIGTVRADDRKRVLFQGWKNLYDTLGFELVSVTLVRVHDYSIL